MHKGVSMNRPSRNNTAKNCSAVTGIYAFFCRKMRISRFVKEKGHLSLAMIAIVIAMRLGEGLDGRLAFGNLFEPSSGWDLEVAG